MTDKDIEKKQTQKKKKDYVLITSRNVVLIAVMSALLITGKFAISFVPNIEVVTTLIIVFSVVFKFRAVFATIVFCLADIFIYPPSVDVIISYFIYWNALSLVSSSLSLLGHNELWKQLIWALLMTFAFGFLTSAFQSIVTSVPFWPIYIVGIPFYIAHVASTLVFMLVGYVPLKKALTKVTRKFDIKYV